MTEPRTKTSIKLHTPRIMARTVLTVLISLLAPFVLGAACVCGGDQPHPCDSSGVDPLYDFQNSCGYDGGYDFSGQDLTGVDITLSGALTGLQHSYFVGTSLVNATLDGADLTGSDLTGALLEGASLTDVIWSDTICPDGTNSDDNGESCCGHLMEAEPAAGCACALPTVLEQIEAGCDALQGAGLKCMDLSGLDLSGADLTDANMTGANLSGANLSGANLTGVDLNSSDLTHVHALNLTACPQALPEGWDCIKNHIVGPEADLTGADLTGANLADIELIDSILVDVHAIDLAHCPTSLPLEWNCVQANLVGPQADLEGANLQDADLSHVNLTEANLALANLVGADLSGARLEGASLYLTPATQLEGCPTTLPVEWDCVQGNLVGPSAWLEGADLGGADLSGLNLSGSILIGANLREADLTGADLGHVFMHFADLTDVIWADTVCPDTTLSIDNGGSCCGHFYDMDPSNIEGCS